MSSLNETRLRVASLLKHYREEAGLTIRQAGEKIGKSNQTVSAWEQGRGQPDAEMFLRLCDAYGVKSVSAFFGEKLDETPYSPNEGEVLTLWRNASSEGKEAAKSVLKATQVQGNGIQKEYRLAARGGRDVIDISEPDQRNQIDGLYDAIEAQKEDGQGK